MREYHCGIPPRTRPLNERCCLNKPCKHGLPYSYAKLILDDDHGGITVCFYMFLGKICRPRRTSTAPSRTFSQAKTGETPKDKLNNALCLPVSRTQSETDSSSAIVGRTVLYPRQRLVQPFRFVIIFYAYNFPFAKFVYKTNCTRH